MRSRLLILCPGQGAQHAGMLDLARTDPRAAALLDTLAPHLAAQAAPVDPAGPGAAGIFSNRCAQPAIVAAGLAMWEALRGACPPPALIAGYSIGELTAYGIAGAFDARTAVSLAETRAQLMDACVRAPQAMVAISGPLASTLPPLLAPHGFHIAIQTSEDSIIAGGPASGLAQLTAALTDAGNTVRLQVLPVAVASHTPAMGGAVGPFEAALRAATWTAWGASGAPVLGGIDAALVRNKDAAVEHLARQLNEPVRWMDCMDAIAEQGITTALELGPGSALAKMLATRHPRIDSRSAADFRTLDGIRRWLSQ